MEYNTFTKRFSISIYKKLTVYDMILSYVLKNLDMRDLWIGNLCNPNKNESTHIWHFIYGEKPAIREYFYLTKKQNRRLVV